MSHLETVSTVIQDLAALKAACARLGVEFRENQTTYAWWGRSVGDYPVPAGLDKNKLGQCAHAIKVPGVDYEVGVVAHKSTPGAYVLAYDFFGSGVGLQKKFCKPIAGGGHTTNMEHLINAYSVEVLKRQAARRGLRCTEQVTASGTIKLTVKR